jgi:hypothetical protein
VITENAWTKIINAGTSAKIFRSLHGPTYYSMIYDDVADTPSALTPPSYTLPATAEKMFAAGDVSEFEYPSAAYVWVTCKGEDGAVIVTE